MDSSLPGYSCSWDFPGKNTEVGCHFLLQGIFSTQGSKPMTPALTGGSLPRSHQGNPYFRLKFTNYEHVVVSELQIPTYYPLLI